MRAWKVRPVIKKFREGRAGRTAGARATDGGAEFRPVMRKFSQSKGAIARGRKYAAVREGGGANHRYGHRIRACDENVFSEQRSPSHVVEGIQRAVRAGARTTDTAVGNAVCN